jgi:tetratricopeptide (TPR) repeat protein
MKFLILAFAIVAIIVLTIWRTNRLSAKIKRAEQAFENGDFQTAGTIVQEILEAHNDSVPAKYIKAKLLIRQSQYLQAIFELNSILAIAEYREYVEELDMRTNLALLYHETQDYGKEIDEYKLISDLDPNNVVANERLGHAMFTKKNYKAALDYLLKVNQLAEYHNCSTMIGISYYMMKEYESAEDYLLRAINDNAENNEARYYLGSINFMRRAYTDAIQFLDLAKKDKKYFIKSVLLLGTIYYEKSDYEQTVKVLESGLKSLKDKAEEAAEYRYLLANAYEILGKIKEATYHWEKISMDTPGYRDVRDKLDSYRTVMSDPNLAELFSKSIEENQTLIKEILALLQYNVLSSEKISNSEYYYKALNIKRPNEPPTLIVYLKTTRELNETHISDFQKKIALDKYKSGIFITTGTFNARAKVSVSSRKEIDLIDAEALLRLIEKTKLKMSKG